MKTHSYSLTFLVLAFVLNVQSAHAQKRDAYKVVINHEEQYSVWPVHKTPPRGWQETGISGNQARCREYIEEVWTDMRPLSIKKMNLSAETEYSVVINHEEQYSIWPKELPLPESWKTTHFHGTLYPCVKYIKEVWTDMRPLSERKSAPPRKN